MTLSIFDRFITQTDSGEIVPNAVVTVERVSGGGVATLWQDKAGSIPQDNPVTATALGRVTFYLTPGTYNISADIGGNVVPYNDVIVTAEDQKANRDLFIDGVDFTAGVTTELTLSSAPSDINNTIITFDEEFIGPDKYSLSGTTLTFNAPISGGVFRVYVWYGVAISQNYFELQTEEYDSVADLITSSPSTDSGRVIGYYDGWQDTDAGPKGGFSWHKTGGTNSSPTVGTAVSAGSIGGGDGTGDTTGQSVQAGYFWAADGAECYAPDLVSLDEFGANGESGTPAGNVSTEIADLIAYTLAGNPDVYIQRGNFLASGIDLEDYNVGTFLGKGIDATQVYASANIASGPYLDLGWDSSDTVHPSNIQFGDVGQLSIRSNGFTLNYGASFDQYRRGYARDIRLYGNTSADELENGFKYNYCWETVFDHMLVTQHYGVAHEFGTSSLNAITLNSPSAGSERSTATNYRFNGGNSILLTSPVSEGKQVAKGFVFGSNVRSITIINPHIESANAGFFKEGANNNGASVTIIGGAAFGCETCLNFAGALTDLNINGFCMYDMDSLSNLDIQINARTAVINNLTVIEATTKTKATEEEIINAITLGSNCERCIVNGVDIVPLKLFTDFFKETFNVTIDPGTPQALTSRYLSSMARRVCKVFATQRTSSSVIGHINSIVTVTEDDTIDQDSISARNGSTGLVISYNTGTDQLEIDGSVAGPCKVVIEHLRP